MKPNKSDRPEVERSKRTASPLDELLPEAPPKLMALLTKAERNRLLYWLWTDTSATPRSLLAWPGWTGAFERRNAKADATWASVDELVSQLRAVAGTPPVPGA